MKSPLTGKEMVLRKEKRTLSFRKEQFEVVYHHYFCEDSSESFTTTQLDELNLTQVYNQYRVKHKLPFTEEIKNIRLKYGLSASKMAEVLGFGANTYRNYEAGEIPSQSNAQMIQLAENTKAFKLIVESSPAFEGKDLDKILMRIESIIRDEKQNFNKNQWISYLIETEEPSAYTGYKKPNLEKLTEMVVFFTEKLHPYKTMLNKLLFYADFGMFKESGFAISGFQYQAIQMGPVPFKFQSIFEYLDNNHVIEIRNNPFPNGEVGEQFLPNPSRSFNPEPFTEQELTKLEEIATRFKNY
jgi:putative zinc finger/helix-turn-helix YgiT family protein